MSVRDAINCALNDDPTGMKDSIFAALDSKVADALELEKISMASEMFNEKADDDDDAEENGKKKNRLL